MVVEGSYLTTQQRNRINMVRDYVDSDGYIVRPHIEPDVLEDRYDGPSTLTEKQKSRINIDLTGIRKPRPERQKHRLYTPPKKEPTGEGRVFFSNGGEEDGPIVAALIAFIRYIASLFRPSSGMNI